MNPSAALVWRLATAMMQIAMKVMPGERIEWAKAMLAEFYHLDRDYHALLWAGGCVVAGLNMRIQAMVMGNLKISRWILVPEMALCFVPLTLAWLESIYGVSGIIRLNVEIIQQYFIGAPGGVVVLTMMISLATLGILGPMGLLVTFRLIVLNRPLHSRWIISALVTGPAILGVIYLTGWLLMESLIRPGNLGAILQFSILPVLGAAHLVHISLPRPVSA